MLPVAGNSGLEQTGKDAYAEIAATDWWAAEQTEKIMSEDVGKLNQLIHEKLPPVIGVKKKIKNRNPGFKARFLLSSWFVFPGSFFIRLITSSSLENNVDRLPHALPAYRSVSSSAK